MAWSGRTRAGAGWLVGICCLLGAGGCGGSSDEGVSKDCSQTQAGPDGMYGETPLRVVLPNDSVYESEETSQGWRIKIGWDRSLAAPFELDARRLDGEGTADPEVRTEGYPATGMLPTAIVFSEPGCWEVTGRLGDTQLAVVVYVVSPR